MRQGEVGPRLEVVDSAEAVLTLPCLSHPSTYIHILIQKEQSTFPAYISALSLSPYHYCRWWNFTYPASLGIIVFIFAHFASSSSSSSSSSSQQNCNETKEQGSDRMPNEGLEERNVAASHFRKPILLSVLTSSLLCLRWQNTLCTTTKLIHATSNCIFEKYSQALKLSNNIIQIFLFVKIPLVMMWQYSGD